MSTQAANLVSDERKAHFGENIFDCVCDEPEGDIIRTVRKALITPDNVKIFWNKARKYRTIFSTDMRDDFGNFVSTVFHQDATGNIALNGLLYIVDDFVGVYFVTDIKPEDARVHYTYLDSRHHGRIGLTKRFLVYLFETFKFRRLTMELPLYSTIKTKNFVQRSLGFKVEGRKKKAVLFDGEYFDTTIYGLLREEILPNAPTGD